MKIVFALSALAAGLLSASAGAKPVLLTCPVGTVVKKGSVLPERAARDRAQEIYRIDFDTTGSAARIVVQNVLTNKLSPEKQFKLSLNEFTINFLDGDEKTQQTMSVDRETLALTGDFVVHGQIWWSYVGTCVVGKRSSQKNKV